MSGKLGSAFEISEVVKGDYPELKGNRDQRVPE